MRSGPPFIGAAVEGLPAARRASVHDVARQAGVSASTVSAVFTQRVGVRPTTRQAVLAAAEHLHYRPNSVARALRGGRASTIAFAVMDVAGGTAPAIVRGALVAAGEWGYDLGLFILANDPGRELDFQNRLQDAPVSGAIIYTVGDPETYRPFAERGLALAFIDQRPLLEKVDFVSSDSYRGVAQVVHHLALVGRRRIAILAGPQRQSIFRERLHAYRDALQDYGLALDERWICVGPSNVDSGSQAVQHLLDQPDPPDAIFASSSLLTEGAYRALRARGTPVPGQVALVGTGSIAWADLTEPPLSMLEIPAQEIGREAVGLVFARMAAPDQRGHSVLVEPYLTIRASSAAAEVV